MTPIETALMVIQGIATLVVNPKLGGGGIGSARTSELLQMLATLIEGGAATHKELQAFAKEIQALVDQNGEPTRGQWEAMVARDVAAREGLKANRARLELAPSAPAESLASVKPTVKPKAKSTKDSDPPIG